MKTGSSGRKSILAQTGNMLASSSPQSRVERQRAFKGQMEGIWCTGFCLFICLEALPLTLPCGTGNLPLVLQDSAQSHLLWEGCPDLCRQSWALLPQEACRCIVVSAAHLRPRPLPFIPLSRLFWGWRAEAGNLRFIHIVKTEVNRTLWHFYKVTAFLF